MTRILKSLIGKSNKAPSPEEIVELARANQVLQFRALQICRTISTASGRAAA